MNIQYKLKTISLAVSLGLGCAVTSTSLFAEEQNNEMEEVVVKASRLQGSAAAVVEERRNQAFVADILGSEQMSKTGDSDAASALRRVTGLTLVDGKFIYVRGLGERYSSARLNGASIPSPDLTRNVIPLDIFPSSIIESLSVQKAFSPSMPASFGGGAIDIRTKTVPQSFTGSIEVGVGYDSESSSGYTYDRNGSGVPQALNEAIVHYKGDFSLRNIILTDNLADTDTSTRAEQAAVINGDLLKSLPRNLVLKDESLDPTYNIKASLGNSFDEDYFGGRVGFLAALTYDKTQINTQKTSSVISENLVENCSSVLLTQEDVTNSCYNTTTSSDVMTDNKRLSGVFNLGYELDSQLGKHKLLWSNIYLKDAEDETTVGIIQSPNGSTINTIASNGVAQREHQFTYEERELKIMQFIGEHTFLDYGGLGFDWQYTDSEATTEVPTDIEYKFIDRYEDSTYVSSSITGDDNRIVASYLDLQDNVTSYSGNLTLPIYLTDLELEFKLGYDFADKGRYYTTSSFGVNNDTGVTIPVSTGADNILSATGYLTDDLIDNNSIFIDFNEPSSPDADDYLAGQKIDAGYGAFDIFYKNTWRVSGGIRWEGFKQVSIATSSLIFNGDDLNIFFSEDNIAEGTIQEDDYFSSLALTYMGDEDYQVRLSYGETVIRPDLREVVPVAYFDPLTDIRTIGRVDLESSPITHYDARYESYGQNGDNYSIGLFYKDIEKPIESILSVGDQDYSLGFVNGEKATVYGIEAEWLYDLSWLSDGFFTSGNITLSDSEVEIDPALAGNLTNTTKRMSGHSQYVANLQMNYDSANGMHSSSLVYNVFGERILASGVSGSDDAYEQPFHSLDLVYTYYPDFNSKIKLKVKNLLDEDQEVTQSDIVVRSKAVGINVSLSYTYDFE
ncbi:TonB-dependent receptor plug domain-containing protein [Pseudocolwellia sp. AS88]|uniref:TonB-dependent receptor plug domain-containing protein n=1 Tax=Pseudocolwellia sp. AS88 TaxID=3063958 RepID=UPI0026EC4848|nr:TonB-dependent receptor plug domain-containing protein [Pseudocolwellia sp. AS88]MDO7085754.1 TonB-dependent receptor plug domain-containing protein [Pseudocolwellia sp. AS88]